VKPRYTAALALVLIASNAFALTGEQYLSQATVPPAQARKLALKTYPGKIVSEELAAQEMSRARVYTPICADRHWT
jgi:hypothetical protein